jgi:YbbR domain-containing protein
LNVPIVFRNMPAYLEISSENIPSVQIRVRGPESRVRRLQSSDVSAEIDLTGVKPGELTVDLTHQIHVPDKLEVAQVVPSEARLSFDLRSSRTVPVEPRVIGNFVPGYKIAGTASEPATVEITGPKRVVDSISVATTDPVDVSGVIDRITASRHAYVSDPLIQVTNPRAVLVTVTMEKETTTKAAPPQ